jgi:hypothetical protein
MYISIIIAALILSVSIANVKATGLSRSDIVEHPEYVCMNYGDEPDMKDLCDWINICDDTGEVNSTSEFCIGEAISNPPGPATCPTGYHSTDDDETGLCYTNAKGCEYEGYIFRPDNRTCGEILDVCHQYPDLKECTVTINLGTPENYNQSDCEYTVPDFCFKPYVASGYMSNGTLNLGTNLDCRDVNVTDFRVTVQDRHTFDRDYDGIGCENNETD